MAFGRMNPPTTGHEKLIKKVHAHAKSVGGTAHVITSHSHDKEKNPVPQKHKIKYLKKVAPSGVKVSGSSKSQPSIFHHAAALHKAGHTELTVVAGSDRVKEFHTSLNKYNGVKGRHGHYNFKKINVVSSGDRDPDAEGTAGISGTKMREHAKKGDHKSFKKGLPKSLHPHAEEIMSHIKESEEFEFSDIELEVIVEDEWDNIDWEEEVDPEDYLDPDDLDERVMSFQQRIKAARRMKIRAPRLKRQRKIKAKRMAPQARLKYRARKSAIAALRKRIAGKRGANYGKLPIAQKITIDRQIEKRRGMIDKIAKRMLPKVRKAEVSRLAAVRNRKSIKSNYDVDFADYIAEGVEDVEMYNYRLAEDMDKRCDSSCGSFDEGYCKMFDFEPVSENVCDEWYPSTKEGAMEEVVNEANNYRVKIPGLPDMFLPGKSPNEVRVQVRKIVKPGIVKEVEIVRIQDAEVKKVFRLRAQGKDGEEQEVDEAFEEFMESTQASHDHIYPKKQAIKWKVKPPAGTKNIHPDSPYAFPKSRPGLKDFKKGTTKTNEDAETEGDDTDRRADFKTHKWRDPRTGKWFDKKVKKKLDVDKVTNEEFEAFAEGDMKSDMAAGIKWAYKEPVKWKNLHSCDTQMIKDYLKHKEDSVDEARRGRPKKNPTGDEEHGGEHIVMQLRKSVSLRGQKHVEFADGSKHKVNHKHAAKALDMHSRMKPHEKERFEKHVGMSHKHMQNALKGHDLPKKRNPITGKTDHSWLDHERGHAWKEEVGLDEVPMGQGMWKEFVKAKEKAKKKKAEAKPINNGVEVDEATANMNSVQMLDLLRLFNKAMAEKPGSSSQRKYQKEIDKVKKQLGIRESVNIKKAHAKIDNEGERDAIKHQRMKARARMKDLRLKIAAKESLMRKAAQSNVDYETILEVYCRGIEENNDEQKAFDRVNSFINKGEAINIDSDLVEEKE